MNGDNFWDGLSRGVVNGFMDGFIMGVAFFCVAQAVRAITAGVRAVNKAIAARSAQRANAAAAQAVTAQPATSEPLYHYTNEKGMKGIVESEKLNPSLKAVNPKDARYGNGQYLTDITPGSKTPRELSKEFLHVSNPYKYIHYVEIDVAGLNVMQGRSGVYYILNIEALDLSDKIISFGAIGG